MPSTWLNFGEILLEILDPFSPVEDYNCISWEWLVWLMSNKKEMRQLDAPLTRGPLTLTFDLGLWPWIFEVKLYIGNGRPNCHGTKGRGVNRMPWCETLRKWVNWMLRWPGYLWPWIFKVKLYIGNGRPDCHGTKGRGVDSMPWCKTQPLCDLEAEDSVRDRVTRDGSVSINSSSS